MTQTMSRTFVGRSLIETGGHRTVIGRLSTGGYRLGGGGTHVADSRLSADCPLDAGPYLDGRQSVAQIGFVGQNQDGHRILGHVRMLQQQVKFVLGHAHPHRVAAVHHEDDAVTTC